MNSHTWDSKIVACNVRELLEVVKFFLFPLLLLSLLMIKKRRGSVKLVCGILKSELQSTCMTRTLASQESEHEYVWSCFFKKKNGMFYDTHEVHKNCAETFCVLFWCLLYCILDRACVCVCFQMFMHSKWIRPNMSDLIWGFRNQTKISVYLLCDLCH